ncbi:MAG: tetratricopeptide repeat protein [Candidatus Dependentiae bacterium]
MNKHFLLIILFSVFNGVHLLSATDESKRIEEQFKACMQRGEKLFEDAQYDEARAQFEQAKKLCPQEPRPYAKIFWIYYRQYDADKALSFLQEVPQIPEDHTYYVQYLNLFRAAYTLKADYEKRDEYLNKIVELDVGDNLPDLLAKARAYDGLKQYEDALACYERLVALMDDEADERLKGNAFFGLGHTNIQLKKYDEAIAYFEKALEHRVFAQGYDSLGTAYRNKGDYENARCYYEKAVEIDPLLANAWAGMGRCHRAEGNLKQAKECLQKGIEVYALHGQSRLHLIHVLIDEGNIKEARQHINVLQERKMYPKGIAECLKRIENL